MVLYKSKFCPHSIRVSTPASHVGHRGSNPLGGTKKPNGFFLYPLGIGSFTSAHFVCRTPRGDARRFSVYCYVLLFPPALLTLRRTVFARYESPWGYQKAKWLFSFTFLFLASIFHKDKEQELFGRATYLLYVSGQKCLQ